jgi:hypothetical protein
MVSLKMKENTLVDPLKSRAQVSCPGQDGSAG